jgi:peroxiredoxin
VNRLLALAAVTAFAASSLTPSPARAGDSDVPSALAQKSGPVEVGKPFPSFAGWGLDGQMVNLKRLLEKPRGGGEATRAVVVSFFATWCKPCKKNLPPLARTVAAAGPGVKAVLVDFGPEESDKVKAFVADLGLTYPVLLDPYTKVSTRCGVTESLPRTFVLDGKGVLTAIFVHEGSDFEKALAAEIAKAAAPAAAAPAIVKADASPAPVETSAKVEVPAKADAPGKPQPAPKAADDKPTTQAKADPAK